MFLSRELSENRFRIDLWRTMITQGMLRLYFMRRQAHSDPATPFYPNIWNIIVVSPDNSYRVAQNA